MIFLGRFLLFLFMVVIFVRAVEARDYKVGLLLPFSGVYAGLGVDIENGFRLGLEKFSGRHDIEVIRADSEANPSIGLSKTKKLIYQDKVDVMAGVVSSAVLAAMRDTIHNSGVPLVVANAGNVKATGVDCSPYIVRVSFSNAQIVRPMGEWMASQGIKSAYLMAPDYAAGHQMMDAFRASFESHGGRVVGESYPPFKGTKDYSSYLAIAKASGAESMFVFFAGGSAITFVKQYKEFGIGDSLPLYAAGFLTSPAYVQVQGESADGIVGSLHYLPSLSGPENVDFQSLYRGRYDKVASEFAVAGYDAARVLVEAIDRSGGGDSGSLVSSLREVSFVSPRGNLRIDSATNNIIQSMYIFANIFEGGEVRQEVLSIFEDVRDDVNGCSL